MLKRSRVITGGDQNPFLKKTSIGGDDQDVLGPNSLVHIKKSQLDHLLNSLKSNKAELENLKQKVETRKTHNQSQFVTMNKSLVYKHDYQRDKPFALSLHQIKQLASTPIGYGLHMLELFDMTEMQLKQQKHAVQQRIDMYESMMMQSQLPLDASQSMSSLPQAPP